MKSKPDYEEYYKGVKTYVWINNGDPRVKINRKIKDKNGEYRYVDYFRLADMPNILKALELAESFMSAFNPVKADKTTNK